VSYSLLLFLPVAGEDPRDTAMRDEPDFDRPISRASRVRNAAAIAGLLDFNDKLEVNEGEGFVQILDPHDGTGIIVELNDASGAISVPYWHDRDADKVLARLTSYLSIIHDTAGFSAFDPQTEELVDPAVGIGRAYYVAGVHALDAKTSRPWWKFWQ